VADDDEESALLSRRGSRRSTNYRGSEAGQEYEDHFAQFRGAAEGPRRGTGAGEESLYGSVRRESRRASLLGDMGGPELLIKEVEDEAGNIIEVVVGQVTSPRFALNQGLIAEYGGANNIQLDQHFGGNRAIIITSCIQVQRMDSGHNYVVFMRSCNDLHGEDFGEVYGSGSFVNHIRRYRMVLAAWNCANSGLLLGINTVSSFQFSFPLSLQPLGTASHPSGINSSVALVVLFADSLNALIPDVSTTTWKIISFLIFIPLSFVPLSILSYTSILGILGTLGCEIPPPALDGG
jgi:hypothetical protein